jgi:Ca2+-binding EF-hand superfamily protein
MKTFSVTLACLAVAAAAMAQTSSVPELDSEFERRFKEADLDRNGGVSPKEADQARFSFSKTFQEVDRDGNGLVTLAELGRAFQSRMRGWLSGVETADENKDGYLSEEEAAKSPSVSKVFTKADADRDGRVSRQEYETFSRRDLYGNVDLPYVVPNLFEKKF